MHNHQSLAQIRGRWCALFLTCGILAAHSGDARLMQINAAQPSQQATNRAQLNAAYANLPLSFEANPGQAGQAVKFHARGAGYQLALTTEGATLDLHSSGAQPERAVVRMKLAHANPAAQLTGLDELPGKSNYFVGNDAQQWRTNVPSYARVKTSAVYPGVDVIYYGQQRQLEYDFIVQPGADPRQIELAFEGMQQMCLDADGALILQTTQGELRQHPPVIYQATPNGIQFITGGYQIRAQAVGFELGDYDASQPLVIDPVLSYASYFGGNGFEHGNAIALDAAGKSMSRAAPALQI